MSDDERAPAEPTERASDALEPLFGVAGRRPQLPEREVAPIRAAARAAWQRSLRRAALRRRVAVAVGLAACLLLGLGVFLRLRGERPAPVSPQPAVAELVFEVGEVRLGGTSAARHRLHSGGSVVTGSAGRAALRLAGGTAVRLDVDTSVRLESGTRIALARGALYVDADPSSAPVAVVTPLGTVRHVGTQFEVRMLPDPAAAERPGALRVTVREGAVEVAYDGVDYDADAGAQLTLRADGAIERDTAALQGAPWEWTQHAAPPFAIEGRTLAAFLAWASRETGLRWRYADPGLERVARETILHGSVVGLTPEEALSVVLTGCGLRHRRSADDLTLERLPPP